MPVPHNRNSDFQRGALMASDEFAKRIWIACSATFDELLVRHLGVQKFIFHKF
jgi:hypothetical protein